MTHSVKRMNRSPLGFTTLLLALLLVGASCKSTPEEAPRSWRLSHITSDSSAWHQGALEFARLVGEELPEFEVEVYPFGQLANGDQKTELQMARSGTIHLLLVSPIVLAQYVDPRFDVLNLPFLFPDHRTAHRVISGGAFSDEMTGLLGEKLLIPLAWGANGFRQLTTSDREVRVPADLEGLEVRVAGSRLFQDIFANFGATGTRMSFGELFTSLEQGTIDAQENPLSIVESSRFYEVQKNVTLWNYVYDPIVMVVSVKVWDTLSPREKSILGEKAREAMQFQVNLVEREDTELPDRLAEQGMNVIYPAESAMTEFREMSETIHQRYRPRIGAQLVDLLKASIAAERPVDTPVAEEPAQEQIEEQAEEQAAE